MNTPVAYKYLTALSDNDLLAEWDRVTDFDPPDYSLEAAIDHETIRRVGEPEVDGTQLLARKLHDEAKSAHNRELIDRVKGLEARLRDIEICASKQGYSDIHAMAWNARTGGDA